jgi:probable F420-dependent oxidoreductase
MKVGIGYTGGWLTGVKGFVEAAEQVGYDYVNLPETQHDSVVAAALAAEHSHTVQVTTHVSIAFARSPMVMAMEAWDLQHLSAGRFTLGLGSQVKSHNERRFGVPWPAGPAPRMREYIRALRSIWSTFQDGVAPDFRGKFFQFSLMSPNFNPGPIPFPRPRIGLATVGPVMAKLAGEVADAVFPGRFTTDTYMREVFLPSLAMGLSRSNRTWADIEISGGGLTVYGENEVELEEGLRALRQQVAFYGSTPAFHGVFAVHGLQELGDHLHQLSLRGHWSEMESLITDGVLRTLAHTSTYDDLPKFIARHREYATRMSLPLPLVTPAQRERARHVLKTVRDVVTPKVPRGFPED